MVSGLRVEDRLDGQSNFGAWKERIISVLEEPEVWDIAEKTVVPLIDATQLVAYKKNSVKSKRVILDGANTMSFLM